MSPQIRKGSRLLRSKLRKELVVRCQLALPQVAVQPHHLPEALRAEVEATPVEIAIFGLQSERALHSVRAIAAALHDPFQYAHVLTKTGPGEFATRVSAEPVDVENFGWPRNCATHREPVPEVVADVIPAERQHRERIAADFPDLAGRSRGRFGTHCRGLVDAVLPTGGLDDQRHGIAATRAEDERRNRHAFGIVHSGSSEGHCVAATVKRALGCAALRPQSGVHDRPCQSMRCGGGSRVMPSHHTSPSSVSATLVKITLALRVSMALGFDSYDVPGATPKYPASGFIA